MERVQVLIDKLVQQKAAGESAAQLLYTVQLLQAELTHLQQQQQKEMLGSRKVSVVMPANFSAVKTEEPKVTAAPPEVKAAPVSPAPEQKEKETFLQPAAKAEAPAAAPIPAPVKEELIQPKPVVVEAHRPYMPVAETPKEKTAPAQKDLFGNEAYTLRRPNVVQPEEEKIPDEEIPQPVYFEKEEPAQQPTTVRPPAEPQPFDALAETPTLLQHIPPQVEAPKEINQLIAQQHTSLNDRLKQERPELAHKLKDTPIKDLRKAIGINDRFEFVSELFRGDEAMYERSIKTINSFHILQEAEYWMNRELKVKLGWNDTKEAVQHFYGLVRRRFS